MVVSPADVQHAARCGAAWHFHRADPRRGELEQGAAGRRVGALLAKVRTRREPGIGFWLPLLVGAATIAVVVAGLLLGERDAAGYVIIATALVLLQCSAALLTLHLLDLRRQERLRQAVGTVPMELDGGLPFLTGSVDDAEWGLSGRVGTVIHSGGLDVPVVVAEGHGHKQVEPWVALRVGANLRLLEVAHGNAPDYGLVAYEDGAFRVAYQDVKTPLRLVVDGLRQAPPPNQRDHHERRRCITCPWRIDCRHALA